MAERPPNGNGLLPTGCEWARGVFLGSNCSQLLSYWTISFIKMLSDLLIGHGFANIVKLSFRKNQILQCIRADESPLAFL